MSKKQILESASEKSGLTEKQMESALRAFVETVEEGLQRGEKPAWPGLGTFSMKKRAARNGRNPKTGETISIPEKYVPHLKLSSSFTKKERA